MNERMKEETYRGIKDEGGEEGAGDEENERKCSRRLEKWLE